MFICKRGEEMLQIRPISDLRNHFADISKLVHETSEPVFLTKNGYGDIIVMSIEAYERMKLQSEMYIKLKEELEAKAIEKRLRNKELFSTLRKNLICKIEKRD